MTRRRLAIGIRAKLFLALSGFLALPFLGYEYVRELERFLRDAQERTLAGTAQAVAIALHERPRLFALPADPIATFAQERAQEAAGDDRLPPSASPEIEQIVRGLSRTTARIWVIDRGLVVLARAGSLQRPGEEPAPPRGLVARGLASLEDVLLHPLYARLLTQPTEDFADEAAAQGPLRGHDVEGALAGILTTDRRTTADGRAVIVSAANPIWIGDEVRGAVVVEETTNRVLAERNRAFERLFNIVLAVLLVGTLGLTLFASRLTARIRRLRDDAEAAIDAQGRARAPLEGSTAPDEIGDLSRSFASALARLAEYAAYQEAMASRLAHELRTPVAVVKSSLENLDEATLPDAARIYLDRARSGLVRLAAILRRMTEATRLEGALRDAERERFDLLAVVSGCVDGYRLAYPGVPIELSEPGRSIDVDGAPDLCAQMIDKLVANAMEFRTAGAVRVVLDDAPARIRLAISNEGPPLPEAMSGGLFDSMVSLRPAEAHRDDAPPHLGLGLYIARLIAQFHGGTVRADSQGEPPGVTVTVTLPRAVAR